MAETTPPSTSTRGPGWLQARHALVLMLDAATTALAFVLAFHLRFEWAIPMPYAQDMRLVLPVVVGLRTVMTIAFGLHRWSFRMSGLAEGVRLGLAGLAGTAALLLVLFFLRGPSLPRSVLVMEFFFATTAMGVLRFGPRLALNWYTRQKVLRREGVEVAVIVGAGHVGNLLLRDLAGANSEHHVVGFLDDDPAKLGTHLGGRPVLGTLDDLPRVIKRFGVTKVLIAIPRLPAERIRALLSECATFKLGFKILGGAFTSLDAKVSASMLHDLAPEDLLPRDSVAFDAEEMRGLIAGRRILVTGAAGSIGSEIARQVSAHGAARLVLVDMNENELYLLYRRLQKEHPRLELFAEVADVRDPERLMRLGMEHKPQDVFHAAAHKHVPLLESAPEEAMKNNVFGTINAARMAQAAGTDHFVMISTDKAVRPSSMMGASKRIAELAVRDMARAGTTAFSVVRFGNVLGSAGSVVPLFKEQIARGGPVTVTHPDCTRYFMTIPEAVGLVIIAGLGAYGELCILDMGQAIRIADLAAHLITMAGLLPDKDIPIVYTGLRPGEKIAEELLTEEEEQSRLVRNKVLVAKSPPPPGHVTDELRKLRQAADVGDREAISAVIRALVPTYAPPGERSTSGRVIALRGSPSRPVTG